VRCVFLCLCGIAGYFKSLAVCGTPASRCYEVRSQHVRCWCAVFVADGTPGAGHPLGGSEKVVFLPCRRNPRSARERLSMRRNRRFPGRLAMSEVDVWTVSIMLRTGGGPDSCRTSFVAGAGGGGGVLVAPARPPGRARRRRRLAKDLAAAPRVWRGPFAPCLNQGAGTVRFRRFSRCRRTLSLPGGLTRANPGGLALFGAGPLSRAFRF